MKAFLVFRWVLAALALVKPGSFGEEIDAGSDAKILCDLKNPNLGRKWYWIPQYPICAGVKGGPEIIFSPGTGSEKLIFLDRFQQRLTEVNQEKNRKISPFLIIQTTYMNDSGIFFCSNTKKNSSKVLVTVKPGYQNGINSTESSKKFQQRQSIKLSCSNCEDQNKVGATSNDNIIWTLNGHTVANRTDIRITKNNIVIKSFSSQYYGLWNCNRSMCPGKFKGYCLESDLRTSQRDRKETATLSPSPTPIDPGNSVDAHLIGACVAVSLGFLVVGTVIFFIWRRRQPHSVSETTRKLHLQDSKKLTGTPMKRDEEATLPDDDHIPNEAEGVQYSTLSFRDPGGHQIKTDNENSAVIYSNITAACS